MACVLCCVAIAFSGFNEGVVRNVAGTGAAPSGTDGVATDVAVGGPFGVVSATGGVLYVCETVGHVVRRVDLKSGLVRTVAGTGRSGYSGDGGPALQAKLNEPYEVRLDRAGNLFFVEMKNHVVRRVDAASGVITTVAGTGEPGFSGDGGPATTARLRRPHSIVLDDTGAVFICDIGNHRVRRVDPATGVISTWAGTGHRGVTSDGASLSEAPLDGPRALAYCAGNLYLALREGNRIYRIDMSAGTLHHIAGTGEPGYTGDGGPAQLARLSGPKGICVAGNGDIYLADTESHTIRAIRAGTGIIETVAGTGRPGDGPEGPALHCGLRRPHGVAADSSGRIYIGDSSNNRVRVLLPAP